MAKTLSKTKTIPRTKTGGKNDGFTQAASAIHQFVVSLVRSTVDERLERRHIAPRAHLNSKCRVEGCGRRGGGPRKGFLCETHQSLPPEKKRQVRNRYMQRQQQLHQLRA